MKRLILQRKAYGEGGYEIIYSIVESGGGEIPVDELVDLLRKLIRK